MEEDDLADAESDYDDVAMGHRQHQHQHHHNLQDSETVADVVTRLEDQLHLPIPVHHELHTHGHDNDHVLMNHEEQVEAGDAEAAAFDITADLAV